MTPDGRIFVGILKQWTQSSNDTSRIYVIDSSGKIVHTIESCFYPDFIRLFGDYLIVNSSARNENMPLQIFDIKSYSMLTNYTLRTYITGTLGYLYSNTVYFLQSTRLFETNGTIIEFNINSLDLDITTNGLVDVMGIANHFICNDGILYVVYMDMQRLSVFDLNTQKLITNISLWDALDLPETIRTNPDCAPTHYADYPYVYDPYIIGDELIVGYQTHPDEGSFNRLIVMDKHTFRIKELIDTTGRYLNACFPHKYIQGSKSFCQGYNCGVVTIIDFATRKMTEVSLRK